MVSESFAKAMTDLYPTVKVLAPEEEGFDAPKAISKAVSILQATRMWRRPLDHGRRRDDFGRAPKGKRVARSLPWEWITRGSTWTCEGRRHVCGDRQPLWEESYGAAELLDKTARGEKIAWWTKLPAPFITKNNLKPYLELLDKVEAAIKR